MRPEARAALVDVLERVPGNPSGQHRFAREARRLLDDARDVVAEHLGARPGEIVFTSGGTEADNLAITGSGVATGGRPICLATDHHAVLHPVLAAGGETVAVDRFGVVDLDDLARCLGRPDAPGRPDAGRPGLGGRPEAGDRPGGAGRVDRGRDPVPTLVSMALANNEVGTIQPIDEVADALGRLAPDAVLHLDAVAAVAWTDIARLTAPARLISVSGHKVGGPKGIGALVVRGGTPLSAQLLGGGQERELRSGTPNVAGAVALAAALAATAAERPAMVTRVTTLQARLLDGLAAAIPGLVATGRPVDAASSLDGAGRPAERIASAAASAGLPNIVHVCVPGVEREALLFLLDQAGVFASAGSSCASGALEPSHVLEAMGIEPFVAEGALRLSLGWSSTPADVDHALAVIPAAVERLRGDLHRSTAAMRDAIGAGPAPTTAVLR